MNSREPTVAAYGGVSGRVLREAMSGASLVTGLSLIISLGALSYIMTKFNAGDAFSVFLHLAVIGVLARFAVNGYSGEWGGTVFSSRGGSWMEVGAVGLRYFALSMVWLLPAVLLGWRPETINAALGEVFLGGGSKWLILSCFVVTVIALTPPVFLIVSVGAMRFRDIVDPEHWRSLFRGRMGDLFLIYVLYLGALTMTAVLVLPLLVSVAVKNADVGTVLGWGCLAFAGGLAVNLLGRLCGFYAATAYPSGDWTEEPGVAGPAPDAAAAHEPEVPALPAEGTSPSEAQSDDHPTGKTPLLEAGARVEELARRFADDPEGVIRTLAEFREQYAPNPQVLHLLSLCLVRVGHIEDSLTVALEALPLCLNRGAIRLASELYAVHLRNADRLGLMPDVVATIADELRRLGDLSASERAYMRVLSVDAGETRVIKGLLQLAENHLHASAYAEASRIYEVLIERCGDSPFAVHMHEGLAEARRRMAKAS